MIPPETSTAEPVGSAYPGGIVLAAGVLSLVTSLCLFVVHLIWWMRYGDWPVYTAPQLLANLGLPYPHVSWLGIQKIIDLIMKASAASFLFWAGMAISWIGGAMLEAHDKRVKALQLAKWKEEHESAVTE